MKISPSSPQKRTPIIGPAKGVNHILMEFAEKLPLVFDCLKIAIVIIV